MNTDLHHERFGDLRSNPLAECEILSHTGIVVIDGGLSEDGFRIEQACALQRWELKNRSSTAVLNHVALESNSALWSHQQGYVCPGDTGAEPADAHGQPALSTREGPIDFQGQSTPGPLIEVGLSLHSDEARDLHAYVAAKVILT